MAATAFKRLKEKPRPITEPICARRPEPVEPSHQ
jgi:hypothetical protein